MSIKKGNCAPRATLKGALYEVENPRRESSGEPLAGTLESQQTAEREYFVTGLYSPERVKRHTSKSKLKRSGEGLAFDQPEEIGNVLQEIAALQSDDVRDLFCVSRIPKRDFVEGILGFPQAEQREYISVLLEDSLVRSRLEDTLGNWNTLPPESQRTALEEIHDILSTESEKTLTSSRGVLPGFTYQDGFSLSATDLGNNGIKIEFFPDNDVAAAIVLPPRAVAQCGRWLLETLGRDKHGLPNGLSDILRRLSKHKGIERSLERGDKKRIKEAIRVLRS